ncbi:MAG: hypothetical protein A2Z25_02950 [Planctomycetes bacterium RBG_16_55_9]|nr:MAG: hypothetical protein A2Z25_02950 [Planctomycetes bacterium RBG_16_55_9]
MSSDYSVEVCKELEAGVRAAKLYRPMRVSRYDAGTELIYDVSCVGQKGTARVHLTVEKFVGGGFAGQVYRVKTTGIEGQIEGLEVGRIYGLKILIPPSGFSRLFRNLLYFIGFQAPFQQQVNPAAAKAGALWQKLIRRGAKIRFGDENAVVDIYGTFVDEKQGSCGELREWVEGRTWRLEVDERMDLLRQWQHDQKTENISQRTEDRGQRTNYLAPGLTGGSQDRSQGTEDIQPVGSPEYRAKRKFMHEFVELLHDMGAYEFARQYEWSTCKSQPNALKRKGTQDDPSGGLVAVDFRAGLTLLPFLPMSPGDFKLIGKGLMRGSIVQFDRGDPAKLEAFVQAHANDFTDMHETLEELKIAEQLYRDAIPDITHHHVRLFYSRELWSTMLNGAVTGWRVRNLVDEQHEQKLRSSTISILVFFAVGLIPLLGKLIRRLWARADWRKHYATMLTSADYFRRAAQARIAEKVIDWHRDGRVDEQKASRIAAKVWPFFCHLPLSFLPAGLHRFLTDWKHAKGRLAYYIVRPVRLYFNAELREQWLRDMIAEGQNKHMLSDEDAGTILSQINEPFIQKYLKSLAVHVCTLPVTQVVSVTIALIYYLTHYDQPNAWAIGLGIVGLFQVVPISPGSLTRGLYVLYLVIKERNFKDYNIAVFLGFFKYVGYLAFPIQMTYRYPAMARFMAGHWATEAVHIVPVFGERGALLEHWVFCLFYNWPLTIRRRIQKRAEARSQMKPRYWHVGPCAIAVVGLFTLATFIYQQNAGAPPGSSLLWWLAVLVPPIFVCGSAVTLGCGGATLGRRILAAAAYGVLAGALYTAVSTMLGHENNILASGVWRAFIFAILSIIAALITEIRLPEQP